MYSTKSGRKDASTGFNCNFGDLLTYYQGVFGQQFRLPVNAMVTPRPDEYSNEFMQKKHNELSSYLQNINYPDMNDTLIQNKYYEMDREPSEEEISDAIHNGNKNKPYGAPGRDRIRWKDIHTIFPAIENHICEYFQILWRYRCFPKTFSHDKMIALIKDPNKNHNDPSNYRPIFLQSIRLKVIDRIIDRRLRTILKDESLLEPEQGGFVGERGTSEQSAVLRNIACIMRHEKRNWFAAFIDIKSAFPRVVRDNLLHELMTMGVDGHLLRIIKAMYTDTTAELDTDLILEIFSGVREGGKKFTDLVLCIRLIGVTELCNF